LIAFLVTAPFLIALLDRLLGDRALLDVVLVDLVLARQRHGAAGERGDQSDHRDEQCRRGPAPVPD